MYHILKHKHGIPTTVQKKTLVVDDPLMRKGEATYLLDEENHTAYVEVANSAGLQMLQKEERNPFIATSIVTLPL